MALIHPVLSKIIVPKTKPRIVGSYVKAQGSAGAASITWDLPDQRGAGLLCLALIGTAKGAGSGGTPSTASGFTSLAAIGSGGTPGYNLQYKFLNGTETPSFTTTVTGSDHLGAVVLTLEGCGAAKVPTLNTVVSGTSATPNPGTHTVTAPFSNGILWLTFLIAEGAASVTQKPIGLSHWFEANDNTFGMTVVSAEHMQVSTFDPSAYGLSASLPYRCFTLAVRAI